MHSKNQKRFSALLSGILSAVAIFGTLPVVPAHAAVPIKISVVGSSVGVVEGNTTLLHLQATQGGVPLSSAFEADVTYTMTGTVDPTQDLNFNNVPGVASGVVHMSSADVYVPVYFHDDLDTEGDESLTVTLDNVDSAAFGTSIDSAANQFVVSVADNTGLPFINFSVAEDSGLESQPGVVRVRLSHPVADNVTFYWSADTVDTIASNLETILGGNTFPADFTNAPIALQPEVIPAGAPYIDLNLGVQNDNLFEPNETIGLLVGGAPENARYGTTNNFKYTIIDNDAPSISFDQATAAGLESTDSYTVNVSLSNPSYTDTEITLEGSAFSTAQMGDLSIDGNDWFLPNAMRIIPAGQTSLPVTFSIKDDAVVENSETAITAFQTAPANITLGVNPSFTYTINDNDSAPVVSGGSSGSGSGYGTAIPQSTASVGGVPAGSVVTPSPVVTVPTTPAPSVPGQVLGIQANLLHELIAKLKFGSTSDEVNQLQVELQKLGFFPAKAKTTRYYGVITKAAVEKYLNTKFDSISLQDLATMLKFGQRGNAVKKLQNELKTAGFFPMNTVATGFYGSLTKQAVANYLAR